jgi:hypothetical protein
VCSRSLRDGSSDPSVVLFESCSRSSALARVCEDVRIVVAALDGSRILRDPRVFERWYEQKQALLRKYLTAIDCESLPPRRRAAAMTLADKVLDDIAIASGVRAIRRRRGRR